ncbi:MAG TPA: DUF2950 domain-containing protein [Candidatus Dormibacteraeota bacterium]|nr:DUF2950 domain-containing protein [Candidatus Dormibacteraeota bacterium]
MVVLADPLRRRLTVALAALALALPIARPVSGAPAAARSFASPEEAAQALAAATAANDAKAMLAVLGPEAQPLLTSGDLVADQNARKRFTQAYQAGHSLVMGADGDTVLQVGADGWPFPIPLVKTDAGWHFDAETGREEILDRRIGANELSTIQVCLAYVDAQREYYDLDPDHAPLLHYAQKLASTPGKYDGLYWDAKPGEPESPLGPLLGRAWAEGYKAGSGKGDPYHGYYFRLLTAQGPAAAGGAYDYIAHGKMIGGFGLLAYPAKWDNSGVMTFMVNHDGVVFQKDLGPNTAAAAKAITSFNPDETWQRVDHQDLTDGGAMPVEQSQPAAEPRG